MARSNYHVLGFSIGVGLFWFFLVGVVPAVVAFVVLAWLLW